MRTIRCKLTKNAKILLQEIAREFGLDYTFAVDLYALLRFRGNGIPSDDRVKKMVKHIASKSSPKISELTAGIILRKRIAQLKSIIGNSVFMGLALKKDKFDALRTLIRALQDFGRKARQAQCVTCKYISDCDFGKQYSGGVLDITQVIDPDFTKKVNSLCPVLPDIDKANQMAQAAEAFASMFKGVNASIAQAMQQQSNQSHQSTLALEPEATKAAMEAEQAMDEIDPVDVDSATDEASFATDDKDTAVSVDAFTAWESHLPFGKHTAKFTGNNLILSLGFMQQVTAASLSLYEIGRKFSLAMESQKKGKFKPTPPLADGQQSKKMENIGDMTRLESSQHGLPQEVFEARLNKKALSKRENVRHTDKKQCLYMLIDSSGSMAGWFSQKSKEATERNLFTRCGLAMTLVIALLTKVEKDGGIAFVRFFDVGVSQVITAKDKESFERARWMVANGRFNGIGTQIVPALEIVANDIRQAEATEEIAKSEILLISDIEDRFSEDAIRKAVGKIEFNVLDISGKQFNNQGSSGALKRVATKYYKANEGALDINKLVELI